jgi:hypothetical protein
MSSTIARPVEESAEWLGAVVVVDTGCMERRSPLFPVEVSGKCS